MQIVEKKQIVKNFSEELKNTESIILAHYHGLNVNTINELRRKVKEAGCIMRVVKNRLALRAMEEAGIESYSAIKEYFKGPVAILMGNNDPSRAIKIFKKYIEENKLMEFKGGIISDNFFDGSQLGKIADLPSKDVMIARTVMVLNSPIQGLCNTLAAVIKKLFYVLNHLKEKKEACDVKSLETQEQETSAETAPEQEISAEEVPKEKEKIIEQEPETKDIEESSNKKKRPEEVKDNNTVKKPEEQEEGNDNKNE